MSRNINQIFQDNPATNIQNTDLFYLGRSPYNPENDMAAQFSTIADALVNSQFPWSIITQSSAQLSANNGYFINRPSICMLTMPALCLVGSSIKIINVNKLGNFILSLNDNQTINGGITSTSAGPMGYIQSKNVGNAIEIVCFEENITFWVVNGQGNLEFI
jgi:hypothetical protein